MLYLVIMKTQPYRPHNQAEIRLAEAFLSLDDTQEMLNFLRDLLTPAEIKEFANRLEIAKLLQQGELSYLEVAKRVGTSTTTVTRVAHWLRSGCGGYQKVLSHRSSDKRS